MFKKLYAFIPVLIGLPVFGQITLTQSDIASIGSTATVVHDTVGGVNVGSAGAAQMWDFSNLQVHEMETVSFSDPATTNSANRFPNADLARENDNDTVFFKLNSDSLVIDGVSGDVLDLGFNVQANYVRDQTILKFPATFNDAFSGLAVLDSTFEDTFTGTADSLRLQRLIMTSSTIDAWGEVITPADTFDVVRQVTTVTTIDTVFALFPIIGWQVFFTLNTPTITYQWWANGEDIPVLEMTAGSVGGMATSATYKITGSLIGTVAGTDVLCNGDCNGEAVADAIGGSGNYTFQWDAPAGNQTTASVTGLCPGTYSVTVSDGLTDVVRMVTIGEPDPLMVSAFTTVSGQNGGIMLTVMGGTGNYTYLWTGPNGFNETTKDISVTDNGTYVGVVTDANGCTDTTTIPFINISVDEIPFNQRFNVYPNPTTGVINIDNSGIRNGSVTVLDLLGKEVSASRLGQGVTQLDLTGMPKGVYLIRISSDDQTAIRKIYRVEGN